MSMVKSKTIAILCAVNAATCAPSAYAKTIYSDQVIDVQQTNFDADSSNNLAKIPFSGNVSNVSTGDIIEGTVKFSSGHFAMLYPTRSDLSIWMSLVGGSAEMDTDMWLLDQFGNAFGSKRFVPNGSVDKLVAAYAPELTGPYEAFGVKYKITFKSVDRERNATSTKFFLNELRGVYVKYAPGDAVSAVPEPATWAMMALGFAGVGCAMRRRRTVVPVLA